MSLREFEIVGRQGDGRGLLRMPDREQVTGGIVALHGARLPSREQPLFEHLADTLVPLGFAVLSYDRRPSPDGGDVPFDAQADDALAAVTALRAEIGAPVGLFGFSQGAWAAAVAAARSDDVAFLALVGCSGVSPAVQMRYYTDEQLRRGGYNDADRAEQLAARLALEQVVRYGTGREDATAALSAARTKPWFDLAYLPASLPSGEISWPDMDFDPAPIYARVTCPVLLIYGEDEDCIPAGASEDVWRRAAEVSGNADLTIVDVPGCGHFPSRSSTATGRADISPAYSDILTEWFLGIR